MSYTPDNSYAVPLSQWRKWTDEERRVFNDVFSFSVANQRLMVHPSASDVAPDHWKTVAWNHAWFAADALRDIRKSKK